MYCVSAADIHVDDLHWKKRRYNSIMAYSESKLTNVLFSAELARRLEGNFYLNLRCSIPKCLYNIRGGRGDGQSNITIVIAKHIM